MKDESNYTTAFTGDFINEEPVVFKGLTDSEIKQVFLLSLVIGAPLGVILGLLTGVPMLIVCFVLIIPIITVFFVARWMANARRGKPPGYVEQRFHVWLASKRLIGSAFVTTTYKWGLGRTIKQVGKK